MRRLAWVACAVVLGLLALPGVAGAATGYAVVRKDASGSQQILVAARGYSLLERDRKGRNVGGMTIDYRKRTVAVLDVAHKRVQRMDLRAAVARARREHAALRHVDPPYFKVPDRLAFPQEHLKRLPVTTRIKGLRARAYRVTLKGQPAGRAWYAAALPAPPAAVRRLLRATSPGGRAALAGAVALRTDVRSGKRWRTTSRVRSVRRVHIGARAFAVPGGYKPATLLDAPRRRARPASTPSHLRLGTGLFPNQDLPVAFAVFWGRRFAREPGTVSRLLRDLDQTILRRPYVDGLAQYGVNPGAVIGHEVLGFDPPPQAGERSAGGWSANSAIVELARASGAPPLWPRLGPDPMVVLYEPMDALSAEGNRDNLGYHTVMPVGTALLDPLGLVVMPVYPWIIVKVPPADGHGGDIDSADITASHETAETATDTITTGWTDPDKSALGEQGEVADICHEGNHAPWDDWTRVGGVAVATYWSESARSCVPATQPSVRIDTPADGATAERGRPVALHATASDPSGATPTVTWTSDRDGVLGSGTALNRTLSVGHHVITATATVGPLARAASVAIDVVSRAPSAAITTPQTGTVVSSDQVVTFRGTGHDIADGDLHGDALRWSDDGVAFGSGDDIAHTMSTGNHMITLVSVNTHGEQSAPASIVVYVGGPAGDPSAHITTPHENDNFPQGETSSVSFTGSGSTSGGTPLSGANLQWYDDYTDARNVPHHDLLGTGISITHTLYSGGTQRAHTITLRVTDPGNSRAAVDVVHVSSGVIG